MLPLPKFVCKITYPKFKRLSGIALDAFDRDSLWSLSCSEAISSLSYVLKTVHSYNLIKETWRWTRIACLLSDRWHTSSDSNTDFPPSDPYPVPALRGHSGNGDKFLPGSYSTTFPSSVPRYAGICGSSFTARVPKKYPVVNSRLKSCSNVFFHPWLHGSSGVIQNTCLWVFYTHAPHRNIRGASSAPHFECINTCFYQAGMCPLMLRSLGLRR